MSTTWSCTFSPSEPRRRSSILRIPYSNSQFISCFVHRTALHSLTRSWPCQRAILVAPPASTKTYPIITIKACFETLIPEANEQDITIEDDLLAATVILGLWEEFDDTMMDTAPRCTVIRATPGQCALTWRVRISAAIPLQPRP